MDAVESVQLYNPDRVSVRALQVLWALNLTVGVWFVGRALSTQPLACFLAGHVLMYLDGAWRLYSVPEQYTVGCFVLAGVALPLTLWTAALTSYM